MENYRVIDVKATIDRVLITTSSEDGLSGNTYNFATFSSIGICVQMQINTLSSWTRKTKRHKRINSKYYDRFDRCASNLELEDIVVPVGIKDLAVKTCIEFIKEFMLIQFHTD